MQQDKLIVEKFLIESNAIEGVFGQEAYENAKMAWDYMQQCNYITVGDVLVVHDLLMQKLRPDIAGEFRTCAVYIGGRECSNEGPVVLASKVVSLCEQMNSFPIAASIAEKTLYARKMHVRFEKIHPFEDGNGRTGRIIYNWHLLKLGLPIHVIHEGDEQQEYYKWFTSKRYE